MEQCHYELSWSVIDAFGNILARPFPKFFNYGQPDCPEIDIDELAVVSDKMDGSLGILYPGRDGKYYIATRGSFESEQAIHATKLFQTKYADYIPPRGITMLFEIVYPENRIVCNYGDTDDLVLIGSVDNANGDNWDADQDWDWPGPKAEIFPFNTMREALEFPPREGKEGFVVHFLLSGHRVKIKQEDYIQLHRIVTGLNARSVWQAMVDGTMHELYAMVPDEFYDFVKNVQESILNEIACTSRDVEIAYNAIGATQLMSRKEFAMQALKSPLRAELFLMYDGKDLFKHLLMKAKPAHNYSPVKVDNDAD
jgi:RNA ligase